MSLARENKILRKELAKVVTDSKRKDTIIAEQAREIRDLKGTITELRTTVMELMAMIIGLITTNTDANRHLAYYENPHSPPSQNSIPTRQKKAFLRKENKKSGYKKPGRKIGHIGVSHHRKSIKTVRRAPHSCHKCGSDNLHATGKTSSKQITDIPYIPQAETITYVTAECKCEKCGTITGATQDPAGIRGTQMGPRLVATMVQLWYKGCSTHGIADIINDTYKAGICKGTIQYAMDAASNTLKSESDAIKESLSESKYIKMDETTIPIRGKRGYVWVCIGDKEVHFIVAGSRSPLVIEMNYPGIFHIPITCDGFPGYNIFKILQRCWAHILRESKDMAKVYGAESATLHQMLKEAYSYAKSVTPGDTARHAASSLEARVASIAAQWERLGCDFGGKLARAAPNLFTFMLYPGMEPTNNESERMLRPTVIQRNIRMGLVTEGGMAMFGRIMTCMMTWRKRGLNTTEMLLKVLGAT